MPRPSSTVRPAWLLGALFALAALVAVWPAGPIEADPPAASPGRTPLPTTGDARRAGDAGASTRSYLLMIYRDPTPTPAPTPTPQPLTTMVVGAGVIDNNFEMARDMGFPWIKLNVDWTSFPDPTSQVDSARSRYPGVKILLRIDNAPASVRSGNNDDPLLAGPTAAYLQNLAGGLRGKVQAYELFNEPNLQWEWNTHIAGGGSMPSALGYARILRAAYPAIKAGDPNALVVSGGVASAGSGGSGAIGDLDFLNGLYSNGARGSFDAIGTHPYGGACTYDVSGCSEGIYFRRAELQHSVSVAQGDSGRPMWATELGWLTDPRVYAHPECMTPLGGRALWVRGPDDVAAQLSNAYRYAAQNWPWMGGMFFFNFDYSAAGWVTGFDKVCDTPTWYSIVSKTNMPPRPATEPAYAALLQFSRDYRLTVTRR